MPRSVDALLSDLSRVAPQFAKELKDAIDLERPVKLHLDAVTPSQVFNCMGEYPFIPTLQTNGGYRAELVYANGQRIVLESPKITWFQS